MKEELRKSRIEDSKVFEKKQSDVLPRKNLFSQETIDSFVELGSVVKDIRKRLLSEGYVIKNGKITKP
jgi:hypothetical protein